MSVTFDGPSGPDAKVGLRVELWRHRDASVRDMPGAYLGDREIRDEAVSEAHAIYHRGARFVSIPTVVDLSPACTDAAMATVLSLVRELTSHGMEVAWRARIAADDVPWWVFNHLHPPAGIDGPDADGVLASWRCDHHFDRCILRRGPGFVQIRDLRRGGLRRFTITDVEYLSAIDALLAGRPTDAVPGRILAAFEAQGLVARVG